MNLNVIFCIAFKTLFFNIFLFSLQGYCSEQLRSEELHNEAHEKKEQRKITEPLTKVKSCSAMTWCGLEQGTKMLSWPLVNFLIFSVSPASNLSFKIGVMMEESKHIRANKFQPTSRHALNLEPQPLPLSMNWRRTQKKHLRLSLNCDRAQEIINYIWSSTWWSEPSMEVHRILCF